MSISYPLAEVLPNGDLCVYLREGTIHASEPVPGDDLTFLHTDTGGNPLGVFVYAARVGWKGFRGSGRLYRECTFCKGAGVVDPSEDGSSCLSISIGCSECNARGVVSADAEAEQMRRVMRSFSRLARRVHSMWKNDPRLKRGIPFDLKEALDEADALLKERDGATP